MVVVSAAGVVSVFTVGSVSMVGTVSTCGSGLVVATVSAVTSCSGVCGSSLSFSQLIAQTKKPKAKINGSYFIAFQNIGLPNIQPFPLCVRNKKPPPFLMAAKALQNFGCRYPHTIVDAHRVRCIAIFRVRDKDRFFLQMLKSRVVLCVLSY